MVEKVDLGMIKANGTGQIVSDETGLAVKIAPEDTTTLNGSYDRATGQININIPNIGKLSITGLPTINDIGYGEQGLPGDGGRDGLDGAMGKDGYRGGDGCPGPRGADGKQGKQGPIGRRGVPGPTGGTGPTGETGSPGVLMVFIQDNDPAEDNELAPGALWIRP
ncbi:tail fiber protein [Yersinia phage fHe-Yen9-02]|nr:tail fiber protein [Yersinia phage fHe-Yen9-02]